MVFKVLLKMNIVANNQTTQALHEKRVLNAISYPFVINLLKCFKDNDAVYFVMPFIEGGDMFAYLQNIY
jgi:protein kinase A